MFVSTQDGLTALHLAAQEGKVDVVRQLLTEAQALVNIQTKVHSHHIIVTSDWSVDKSEVSDFCTSYNVLHEELLYHDNVLLI